MKQTSFLFLSVEDMKDLPSRIPQFIVHYLSQFYDFSILCNGRIFDFVFKCINNFLVVGNECVMYYQRVNVI